MLINIFSTHRSGSTWWSRYQHHLYPGSIFLNETFNHLGYIKDSDDFTSMSYHEKYFPGCKWVAPTADLKDIGSFYYEMDISLIERFDRWVEYIKNFDGTVVCHTHIRPLASPEYINKLASIGHKNYYVYRDDILNQLASFQIMNLNHEYLQLSKEKSCRKDKFTRPLVNRERAEWHLRCINESSEIIGKIENIEYVNYETMPTHIEFEGMTYKQNVEAFNRLCNSDQELLLEIYNKR